MRAETFGALGEPSRLRIVELLRSGPFSVGEIADTLSIRQPQVSKHLRVLAESGIVTAEPVARKRIYHLEAAPFEEISDWVDSFERLWESQARFAGRVSGLDQHDNERRREDTMIPRLFKKPQQLSFERSYPASVETVWQAWTEAEMLRAWWGPEKTTVLECEIDLRVGGTIRIVTEAGEGMGKYQGTHWPMVGTFTHIEDNARLTYDARSWTEGEEASSTIEHVNDLTLTGDDTHTVVKLHITITKIGPKAKMASYGMKWGYKQYLDMLDQYLPEHS